MIPLTPKEVVIRIARQLLGESRVHDYLIKRGIGLRQLENGYFENDAENCAECRATENCATENCAAPSKQQLIFMADGKWMHGGITDRLRGMASAYRFATTHNLDFKIFHNSPFSLQEVLLPNKVDWTIDEKQISHNCSVAKPVLLYREDFNNDSALERQLDSKHEQFHLYSCVDTLGEKFPEYFNELFKPSPLLEQQLNYYGEILGTNYSSYSFRFQNKLGDFKEFKFKALSAKKKQKLLNAALQALQREIALAESQDGSDVHKILVTADSPMFLAEAAKLPNVVTVKGESIHIDFNNSKKASDYLKSFTEFFLISRAQSAKLFHSAKFKTYPSNFPKYAALLGNVPYKVVEG